MMAKPRMYWQVKDVPVRLKWIDAPELDQICLNGKGVAYSCGKAPAAAVCGTFLPEVSSGCRDQLHWVFSGRWRVGSAQTCCSAQDMLVQVIQEMLENSVDFRSFLLPVFCRWSVTPKSVKKFSCGGAN